MLRRAKKVCGELWYCLSNRPPATARPSACGVAYHLAWWAGGHGRALKTSECPQLSSTAEWRLLQFSPTGGQSTAVKSSGCSLHNSGCTASRRAAADGTAAAPPVSPLVSGGVPRPRTMSSPIRATAEHWLKSFEHKAEPDDSISDTLSPCLVASSQSANLPYECIHNRRSDRSVAISPGDFVKGAISLLQQHFITGANGDA